MWQVEKLKKLTLDDDEPKVEPLSLKTVMEACWLLEENSMVVCTEGALKIIQAVH